MKKFHKSFLAVLLFICFIIPGNLAYADYFEPPETEPPTYKPLVKLVTPTVVEIQAGKTEVFEITLKNSGSGSAQNFVAQANITSDAPFSVEFVDRSHNISVIGSASSRKLKIQIKVDSDAQAGSYPIELKYNYKNGYDENFNESDTIMVRVGNTTPGPNVSLKDFSVNKTHISAGDVFNLSAVIENSVTQDAHDVQVTIEGLETTGVYLNNSVDNIYFNKVSAGIRENISLDFKVASDAKKGTYTLSFLVKYKDGKGEEYEKEHKYYVTVGSQADTTNKGDIQIIHMSAPTQTFNVNQEFKITFDVINTGPATAKNIKISAATDEGGAVVPKTANIRTVASLASGASETLTFSFAPTSKAATQNYTIGFTVEYETGTEKSDGTNEIMTFSQYAGVNVYNPDKDDDDKDDSKISIPKIIVSAYTVSPQIVSAGQEFDLDLTFQNTHPGKSIENVKAYIIMEDKSTSSDTTEDKGNVFSPVNGSNTFYIDKIGPKSETKHKLRLFCIPDASAKTYTLSVKFEYQDTEFNTYTEEALIGITVKQVTRLETSDISIGTYTDMYGSVPINFQLYNMGKVTLSNLMVSIEAPGFDTISTESTVYYGKFQPSDSNYYDGTILAQEPGMQPVKVVITFEDDSAELHTVEREFTVEVAEPYIMSEEEMEMFGSGFEADRNTNASIKTFIIIGIAAAVVIIAGAGFFVFKKKKQKGIEFDE